MRATQHPSNTRVLGAPDGWKQDDLECHAIPVTDVVYPQGVRALMSFWQPTAEELAVLNAGGLIGLSVIGVTMPPVAIFAEPR
jgi:hypothetical protein